MLGCLNTMDNIQIVILALVQGFTEFLPVSSSAHLILTPMFFGYDDQGLAFDVAVHLGSLAAVILYFRRELSLMAHDFFYSLGSNGVQTENSRLAWMIIIGTLPIIVVGKLLLSIIEEDMRSTVVISTTTILFGLILFWIDKKSKKVRSEYSIQWGEALFIGFMQVLAIIPGTSRSAITMIAALKIGLTRQAASRFSFLLSIPTILMSGMLLGYKLLNTTATVHWSDLALGVLLAFVSAYVCINLFLKVIDRFSMTPFVIYRLLLGLILIGVVV